MIVQTPLSPTSFYLTKEESDKTDDPVLHFMDTTRKRKKLLYSSRTLHSWTLIISVLIIVSLVVSCFRAGLKTTSEYVGRRLASGLPGGEEEPEESAILEACLDMQQATGTLYQPLPPLPSPEEAIALILSALTEQAPGSVTQGSPLGGPPGAPAGTSITFPASEEQAFYAVPSQPGLSRDEGGGLGTGAMRIGEGVYGHAPSGEQGAPWGFLSPTGLFPSSQPYPGFLQQSTLPWQPLQTGPSAHPVAGPSLPAFPRQAPLFPTDAAAAAATTTTTTTAAAAAAEAAAAAAAAAAAGGGLGLVRPPTGGESAAPAKVPRLQEVIPQQQPKPKTRISGWKKSKAPESTVQGLPAGESHALFHVEGQPQEPSFEEPEKDPLWEALQAVPERFSPEPLDLAELQALSPEGRGHEKEEEREPQQEGLEAGSEGLQALEEAISFLEGTYVEIEEASSLPASTASLGPPEPSTSQGLRHAATAYLGDPLPGPSGSVRTATPAPASPSADDGGGGPQAAPPGVSPSPAPQMPKAAHLFYRLPVVLPGRVTRKFDTMQVYSPVYVTVRGFRRLATARAILVKPEITAEDADMLIETSEVLVARVLHDLATPLDPHGPSRAVDKLGRVFLYMDAIISIINILGPQMEADNWWPQVADRVSPATVYRAGRTAGMISVEQAALATRLSRALQVLKTRNRLSPEQTVKMKRDLLCNPLSTKDFKDSRWNPWREDDANS